MLARATARIRELAIRAALGATRGRLVRQVLAESLLLAILGGGVGILLAIYGTKAVAILTQKNLPRSEEISSDSAVLLFALALSVLTGIGAGIVPALQASRPDLNSVLRDAGRGATAGPIGTRSRNWLAIGQVAISMVLLIGAGLMMRSFQYLNRVEQGFAPDSLITMKVYFSPHRYSDVAKRRAYTKEILRQGDAIPAFM